jgi:hypothetical protein
MTPAPALPPPPPVGWLDLWEPWDLWEEESDSWPPWKDEE